MRVKGGMRLRNGMWHGLRDNIIMRNVIYGKGAKKYIKQEIIGASPLFFWHKFEGATALLAQTIKAEQHAGVHEDYGGNHF